jgi:hypothetical protein
MDVDFEDQMAALFLVAAAIYARILRGVGADVDFDQCSVGLTVSLAKENSGEDSPVAGEVFESLTKLARELKARN